MLKSGNYRAVNGTQRRAPGFSDEPLPTVAERNRKRVRKVLNMSIMLQSPLFLSMPGGSEWIIILLIALILFGGRRIPQLAKDLGSGIREFRKSLSSAASEDDTPDESQPKSSSRRTPARKQKKG